MRSNREHSVHHTGDSAAGEAGGKPAHPHASFARAASVESTPRPSTGFETAGSRRASAVEEPKGGYDIILMAETVYSPASYQKLNDLIKKVGAAWSRFRCTGLGSPSRRTLLTVSCSMLHNLTFIRNHPNSSRLGSPHLCLNGHTPVEMLSFNT
jgi:hypothetical protein